MDYNTPTSDYGTIIRMQTPIHIPSSHQYVAETEPALIRQFCRTMTLARGRILYDVCERRDWDEKHVGYLVPSEIVVEARMASSLKQADYWSQLPPRKLEVYTLAWAALATDWPRLPILGARRIVEWLSRLGQGTGRDVVEDGVVKYARMNWTDYWMRVGHGRAGTVEKERACEAVAERMRQVLETWMHVDVSLSYVQGIWERNGLAEVRESARETYPRRDFT